MPAPIHRIASRRLLLASLAFASLASLSGCGLLVVGGSAATTAVVATDRRTAGEQVEDQSIELKTGSEMRKLVGDNGRVAATSYAGLVLLTGDVPTEQDKQKAGDIVSRIEKVQRVVNELRVGAITDLSVRTNDTWITSKVRTALINTKEVPSRTIAVQTERGVVYLLGKVTDAEGQRAAKAAAGVSGVNKVVKLFETVSPESLVDPDAAPAASDSGASAGTSLTVPGTTVEDGAQALPVQ
jgi:osmotically-inducible protein OsmY